ncbi:hypothetical protein [Nocardia asteroides]|uniref:hypothetical protein n=1 Tax=Nocardia asteroides TaxID=1824 RepID=UPI001E4E0DC9|nr:hypothetical protein [Nocardia asteroides]UGT62396.1 hypothetical protein LTT61_03360 [Nocardia asteroides]
MTTTARTMDTLATTSRRALHLLSLLAARPQWSLPELTGRLEVSARTNLAAFRELRCELGRLRRRASGAVPAAVFSRSAPSTCCIRVFT